MINGLPIKVSWQEKEKRTASLLVCVRGDRLKQWALVFIKNKYNDLF